MKIDLKSIIKKIIICIVLIIILFIVNIFRYRNYIDMSDEFSTSYNSYEKNQKFYILKFFKYVEVKEYNKAYDMLSEDCKKEDFNNDINFFINIISTLKMSNNKENSIIISVQNINNEKEYKVYFDKVSINSRDIFVYVYEYAPYSYKLKLNVIDGEGL